MPRCVHTTESVKSAGQMMMEDYGALDARREAKMYDVIGDYHFHRDCIHYSSVTKEPRPEGKHKGRLFIKCQDCGYGMHYYCDSDFENIKSQCRHFEPKEPTLFDYI